MTRGFADRGAALGRRAILGALAVAAPFRAGRAQAPSWPARSLRVLVGYPAGGPNDLVARTVATALSEALGQSVVVENRAGAAGSIAAEAAARAAPDGYLLYMISSAQVLAPSVRRNLGYDPVRDYTALALAAQAPYVLTVHASVPARTLGEFVVLAKARPGELRYASSGVGAGPHLTTALFMNRTGTVLDHIPYRGDAEVLVDLTAGRVACSFLSPSASLPHVQAGTLRALAISGTERLQLLPEVPTIAEAGYPGFDMAAWWGLVGPRGLPPEVVARLGAAMRGILDGAAYRNRLGAQGMTAGREGPAEFARIIRQDRERFAEIVRLAGITPQD